MLANRFKDHGLDPGETAAHFSIERFGCGREGSAADCTHPTNRQYLYLHQGRGFVELDQGRVQLKSGSIVEAPAGGLFRFELSGACRFILISVSDTFIQSKLLPVLDPPASHRWRAYHRARVFELFTGAEMRRQRDEIDRELDAAQRRLGRNADSVVAGYVFVILFQQIFESLEAGASTPSEAYEGSSTRDRDLVLNFRGFVEEGLTHHLSIQHYCRVLGTSYTTLALACRGVLAMTPLEYVHSRIVLEAKRELLHTNQHIDTIGFALGFTTAGYFTRFFTRQTGSSPSEFRRSSRDADRTALSANEQVGDLLPGTHGSAKLARRMETSGTARPT